MKMSRDLVFMRSEDLEGQNKLLIKQKKSDQETERNYFSRKNNKKQKIINHPPRINHLLQIMNNSRDFFSPILFFLLFPVIFSGLYIISFQHLIRKN